MQGDIYRGIGADPDYMPDEDRVEPSRGDRARSEARELASRLTRGGTQPLRDELDDDERMAKGKRKGGY